MAETILEFQDVHAGYETGRQVLRGASLSIAAGEKVGLSGGNGSGKSTLLHVALGLVKISKGRLQLFGRPCLKEADFRPLRGRAGLVFQDADDQLFCPTVAEDVAFGPLNQGLGRQQTARIVGRTLEMLGLTGYENRASQHLSGGEKRLVGLATVLAMSPELLLLDEPTSGLDESSQERLLAVLEHLPQSMVVVSHDPEVLSRLTSRRIELKSGIIKQVTTAQRTIDVR